MQKYFYRLEDLVVCYVLVPNPLIKVDLNQVGKYDFEKLMHQRYIIPYSIQENIKKKVSS